MSRESNGCQMNFFIHECTHAIVDMRNIPPHVGHEK